MVIDTMPPDPDESFTLEVVADDEPGALTRPRPALAVDGPALLAHFFSTVADTTADTYRADLLNFTRYWGEPSLATTVVRFLSLSAGEANTTALQYMTALRETYAPGSVANKINVLRALSKLGRTLGVCGWAIEIRGPKVIGYRDTRGPGIPIIRDMLEAAAWAGGAAGARDYAILRLLADMALRRGEVCSLRHEDVDMRSDPPVIWIMGKGRSARERASLPETTREAIFLWLRHRGVRPGPLFTNFDRAKKGNGGLSPQTIGALVAKYGDKVSNTHVRPHGLRHTSITAALDATDGNVREVRQFSRHKSTDVLLRYDDQRRDKAGVVAGKVADLYAPKKGDEPAK